MIIKPRLQVNKDQLDVLLYEKSRRLEPSPNSKPKFQNNGKYEITYYFTNSELCRYLITSARNYFGFSFYQLKKNHLPKSNGEEKRSRLYAKLTWKQAKKSDDLPQLFLLFFSWDLRVLGKNSWEKIERNQKWKMSKSTRTREIYEEISLELIVPLFLLLLRRDFNNVNVESRAGVRGGHDLCTCTWGREGERERGERCFFLLK